MKTYKFTLKPQFKPYLINENLDKDPVTKEELYSKKFMGKLVTPYYLSYAPEAVPFDALSLTGQSLDVLAFRVLILIM